MRTEKRRSPYENIIKDILGERKYAPGQVEAYLRLQYKTLDHLDAATFRYEVENAVACIDADPAGSRRLAKSYGL
jgi:S-ribosylhomocysteine lyase LuxS involved in autoinducer biosynthesis